MGRNRDSDFYYCQPFPRGLIVERKKRKYGLFHFLFDIFMIGLTCGLWLIWIFVREMRNL